MHIKGTITALITPFIDDQLDQQGFIENIRYQIDQGIDGLLVLGTTGEIPTLTEEEQIQLISIAAKETEGKVPLIVNTGTNSTQKTLDKTLFAESMNASAALIVVPYYNKPTQEGIFRHFQAITDEVNIPIIIYNHPGRTGVNLEVSTLERIAKLPNIAGVKEASGNLAQMEEIKKRIPSLAVYCGCDEFNFPLLCLGADGALSVASNLMPTQMKYLVDETLLGNLENARHAHYSLSNLFKALNLEINPIPIKEAMRLCQMPSGHCRLPLCDLSPANRQLLREVLFQMDIMAGIS